MVEHSLVPPISELLTSAGVTSAPVDPSTTLTPFSRVGSLHQNGTNDQILDAQGQDIADLGVQTGFPYFKNGHDSTSDSPIEDVRDGHPITDEYKARDGANGMRGYAKRSNSRAHETKVPKKALEAVDPKSLPPPIPIPSWSHYSFFYRWTFMFMDELVRRGLKRDLTAEDLPKIEYGIVAWL